MKYKLLQGSLLLYPQLPSIIRQLPNNRFVSLINHVGIEDAAELIILATQDQLTYYIDHEMWDGDERFSVEKFFIMLESLSVMGEKHLYRKIYEIEEEVFISALSSQLLVFDLEDLMMKMNRHLDGEEKNMVEKAFASSYQLELDRFIIFAKDGDNWDLIAAIITTLNQNDFQFLTRLLEALVCITNEHIEDNNGLYHVLTSREQLLEDIKGSREERLEKDGFLSERQAKTFYASFENKSVDEIKKAERYDWIEKIYIKNVNEADWVNLANHFDQMEIEVGERPAYLPYKNQQNLQECIAEFSFLLNVESISKSIDEAVTNVQKCLEIGFKQFENQSEAEVALKSGLIKVYKIGYILFRK